MENEFQTLEQVLTDIWLAEQGRHSFILAQAESSKSPPFFTFLKLKKHLFIFNGQPITFQN